MTSARDLWVPMRSPEDHGPRAYAAQLLEMLVAYNLVADAHLTDDGFVVAGGAGRRRMSPRQVLDEYGDRLSQMVTRVMEHSSLTTTRVSVAVGAPGGPVPYIEHPDDRVREYGRYWPSSSEHNEGENMTPLITPAEPMPAPAPVPSLKTEQPCGACNGEGGSWITGDGQTPGKNIREWRKCVPCNGRGTK